MPLALILSSHVAGSRVGGTVQALSLAARGIDPVHLPTTLFARHPGWGPPGGAPVAAEVLAGMAEGVQAQGYHRHADLLLTGYFAAPEQVAVAAALIDAARAAARDPRAFTSAPPRVVVDAVLGDDGRLYVPEATALAVQAQLLPRADLLAPNAFELGWLTGQRVEDAATALRAAQAAMEEGAKAVLVSSVPVEDRLGVVYSGPEGAWLAAHERLDGAPRGTGDLLTALFAAAQLEGLTPAQALTSAVGEVLETVRAAAVWHAPELPVVALAHRRATGVPPSDGVHANGVWVRRLA